MEEIIAGNTYQTPKESLKEAWCDTQLTGTCMHTFIHSALEQISVSEINKTSVFTVLTDILTEEIVKVCNYLITVVMHGNKN